MKASKKCEVAAVAEQVMGWTTIIDPDLLPNWFNNSMTGKTYPVWVKFQNGGVMLERREGEFCRIGQSGSWWPLADWRDVWEVIEEMREKNWLLEIDPRRSNNVFVGFFLDDPRGKGLVVCSEAAFGDERRAILKVALLALTEGKPT